MKKILTIILLGIYFVSNAQDKLTFTYDPLTGSQTNRTLCVNCSTSKTSNGKKEIGEIEAVTEEDLQKFSAEDTFSYYPNPVKEELYLKWDLSDKNFISAIQIVGVNGAVLKSYSNKKDINSQNIPFQNYPAGTYLVILSYKNGEQKTIKILKQ